jgi:hypothetical protein
MSMESKKQAPERPDVERIIAEARRERSRYLGEAAMRLQRSHHLGDLLLGAIRAAYGALRWAVRAFLDRSPMSDSKVQWGPREALSQGPAVRD